MHTQQTLYRAEGIPAMQNKLFASRDGALEAPSAILELCQDGTGLVFNQCFDPTIVTYDDSYQNDQGYSTQFRGHLQEICGLCAKYLPSDKGLAVDIGCGKGGFVEALRGNGINAIGYDNSYQGSSPYIRKSFFSADSHEKGDLLTLRHVLEHIPSPWQFLAGIAGANGHKGFLYIEVPDLDWILTRRAYFDLFHEHVNYFRAADFTRHFGDSIVQLSKSFGGQYLSVVVDLESGQNIQKTARSRESDHLLQQAFDELSEHEDKIYKFLLGTDKIVIWGAAAKGVMFASRAPQAIKDRIAYAIDINPSKQGYFMPISGVEVLDPKTGLSRLDPSALVVIMNPNYEQEIREGLPPNQPYLTLHE